MDKEILREDNLKMEPYKTMAEQIKNENEVLYSMLLGNFRPDFSIRKDVLEYISKHILEFNQDGNYAYHISVICGIDNIGPEWLEWINQKIFAKLEMEQAVEFLGLAIECINRGYSLEKTSGIMEEQDYDFYKVYTEIERLDSVDVENKKEGEELCAKLAQSTEESLPDEMIEAGQISLELENKVSETEILEKKDGHFEQVCIRALNEMMGIVGSDKEKDTSPVYKMQGMLANLNLCISEITAETEKDRNMIWQLKNMNAVQQNFITKQQQIIMELKNKIEELNLQLEEAERREEKREKIDQHLKEAMQLASQMESLQSYLIEAKE